MIPAMNEEQRARYARHVMLRQIGAAGQRRLLDSRALIIGLGGLGSPVAMYLAASGVGTLVLSDYDFVEISNLQRQIVHDTSDIGRDKVDSAADTIARLNPEVEVRRAGWVLEDEDLLEEVSAADVVVDACDNFQTRFALNAACWRARTPLVSGAALRLEGQVAVFDPREPDSPCYRCLYVDESFEGDACSQVGVLAPLLGIVGSVQAVETLKLLAGFGEPLIGRVVMIDASTMTWNEFRLNKDPTCPVCGAPDAGGGELAK